MDKVWTGCGRFGNAAWPSCSDPAAVSVQKGKRTHKLMCGQGGVMEGEKFVNNGDIADMRIGMHKGVVVVKRMLRQITHAVSLSATPLSPPSPSAPLLPP